MQLKRFTFGNIGIFHALELLENEEILEFQDEADLEWAEEFFEKNLTIPDVLVKKESADRSLLSFFTPEGLQRFAEPLKTLNRLFHLAEYAGLGMWEEFTIDSCDLSIVYQDEYQVIGKLMTNISCALDNDKVCVLTAYREVK